MVREVLVETILAPNVPEAVPIVVAVFILLAKESVVVPVSAIMFAS